MKKIALSLPLLSISLLNGTILEKDGNHLFLSIDNQLKSFNVSVATAPEQELQLNLDSRPLDIQISGEYLYALTSQGLSIYKYESGTTPIFLGKFATQYAKQVEVVANKAYIANYLDGLQIVDISVKSNPIIETFFEQKTAIDLVVDGDYVYLLTKRDGVIILDISKRRATFVKEFKVENFTSITKSGDRLYIANEYTGLYILDISNPRELEFVSRTLTKADKVVKTERSIKTLNSKLGVVETINESSSAIINYDEVPMITSFDSDGDYTYTLNLNNEIAIIDSDGKTIFSEGESSSTVNGTTISINLNRGWNLIGNPSGSAFDTGTLSSNISPLFSYENGEWIKNGITIPANRGFWAYSKGSTTVEFSGEPQELDLNSVDSSNWVLLSSGKELESSNINGLIYTFESGEWVKNPATILPAQGFWLKK